MRVLIVDTCYPAFLDSLYSEGQGLESESYASQWRRLMDECFGTADFYSSNLRRLGHDGTEIVSNCRPLQCRWAKEHGIAAKEGKWRLTTRRGCIPWLERCYKDWRHEVLVAQVADYRPDVVHIQDMNATDRCLLSEIKPHVRIITGQIASLIAPGVDFSGYDLILSSFPHYVERFRREGLKSEYFRLGFEPRILTRLSDPAPRRGAVFVGGVTTPQHEERVRFLEELALTCPFDVWGYGAESLRPGSPLRLRNRGQCWGLHMYRVLREASIGLNHHIDAAGRYANNMRLFEATGAGTLLLTDEKENLQALFELGREVVVYRSVSECAERIRYYLDHDDERETIARAGQRRTLRDHTWHVRMQEFVHILGKYL